MCGNAAAAACGGAGGAAVFINTSILSLNFVTR
jgi:hypothetical protein